MKKPVKIVLFSINILIVILLIAFSAVLIVLNSSKTDYTLKLIQTDGNGDNYSTDTLVLTKKVDVTAINEGDIVIIKNDNTENVITVTKVSGDMLHFNNRFDTEEVIKINEYNLVGKVVLENRTLGKICSFIVNNNFGSLAYILIFGILAIGILTLVIIDMAHIRRKNTAKTLPDSISDADVTADSDKSLISYISLDEMDEIESGDDTQDNDTRTDTVSDSKSSASDDDESDTAHDNTPSDAQPVPTANKESNANTNVANNGISTKLSKYAIDDDVDLQLAVHSQGQVNSDDDEANNSASTDGKSDSKHTESPLTK